MYNIIQFALLDCITLIYILYVYRLVHDKGGLVFFVVSSSQDVKR